MTLGRGVWHLFSSRIVIRQESWCRRKKVPDPFRGLRPGITQPYLVGQRHFGGKVFAYHNPKRERGNGRNVFPRLRFGLLWDVKVALSN